MRMAVSLAMAAATCGLIGCGVQARRLPLTDPSVTATANFNWLAADNAPGVRVTAGTRRARLAFPRPWTGDGFVAPGPLAITLEYRDTLTSPSTLHLRQFSSVHDRYVGHFGGAGDGRWKQAVFAIDPELLASDDDGRCEASIGGLGRELPEIDKPTATPGLEVRAVAFAPLTDALLARSRERRWEAYGRLLAAATKGLQPPTTQPEPADVPDRYVRLGFVPFTQPDEAQLEPGRCPAHDRWGLPPIRMRSAGGQLASGSAAFYALKDLSLSADVTPLRASDGATIGAGCIVLRRSLFAPVQDYDYDEASRRWKPAKRHALVEQWLPRVDGPIAVAAGRATRVRIEVAVPPETRPGVYRGRLTLRSAGGGESADVELTVRPFTLDTLERHGVATGAFTDGPSKQAELADMADHGLNSHMMFLSGFPLPIRNEGGRLTSDWTRWNWWVRRLKSAGMTGPLVIVLGNDSRGFLEQQIGELFGIAGLTKENHFIDTGNERLNGLYIEALRQLVANARANDWPEVVLLPYDEPTERLIEPYRDRCRRIHEALPGVRIYGVSMNRLNWAEQIVDSSDIVVANGSFSDIARLCRRRGRTLWTYGGGVASPWMDPSWVRDMIGEQTWNLGSRGRWWWAYHWTDGEPLLEIGPGVEPGWVTAAYESCGEPIPAFGYQAARAGLDDLRYLLMLDRLIAEEPKSPAAELAADWLAQLRGGGRQNYMIARDAVAQWVEQQPDRDRSADLTPTFAPLREALSMMIGRLRNGLPAGAERANLLAVSSGQAEARQDRVVRLVVAETTGAGSVRVSLRRFGEDLVPPFVLGPGLTREIVLHDPAAGDKDLLKGRWFMLNCRIDKGNLPAAKAGSVKVTYYSGEETIWSGDTSATPAPLHHDLALELSLRDPNRRRPRPADEDEDND
ncbi:MAG: hypothetical protein BIFFINMI_01755 [Phycisphaerae bacterium]|nr:hypothetical protein [Phycisphaerae bacterium]